MRYKVEELSFLGFDTALLHAIAGLIPLGQFNPNVNTHHTLVAVKEVGYWRIRLFQNTPSEEMTEELRQLLN